MTPAFAAALLLPLDDGGGRVGVTDAAFAGAFAPLTHAFPYQNEEGAPLSHGGEREKTCSLSQGCGARKRQAVRAKQEGGRRAHIFGLPLLLPFDDGGGRVGVTDAAFAGAFAPLTHAFPYQNEEGASLSHGGEREKTCGLSPRCAGGKPEPRGT
jgi:hypothetical protein